MYVGKYKLKIYTYTFTAGWADLSDTRPPKPRLAMFGF